MDATAKKRRLIAACVIVLAAVAAVVMVRSFQRRAWLKNIMVPQECSLENPYEYNIKELLEVPPAAIRYDEAAKIRVPLRKLQGLAIGPGDSIYAVGDSLMLILDREGGVMKRVDLSAPASCVSVAEDAKVYLGIGDHVEVFDSEGNRTAVWSGLGPRAVLTSIAVSDADVFVADAGNRVVLRFDREGRLQNRIGEKDKARSIPGLVCPSPFMDLAIDAFDHLWVVNPGRHSLENYSNDGELRTSWGKASVELDGFCGCCNPMHVAILDNGGVITSEKGLARVKHHNPDGSLFGVVAAPDQFDRATINLDLAIDSSGRVFVLDPKRRMVRVFQLKDEEGTDGS